MNKTNKARLRKIEEQLGVRAEPLPTIFISVTDCSVPDPGNPAVRYEYSDATTVGLRTGRQGGLIERLPNESVSALKKRAEKLMPDCRIFITHYAHQAR